VKLVYLASPYSDPDPAVQEQRFKDVSRCAALLMQEGVLVFCPIAHFTPIANYANLPHGWEFYAPFDRAFLEMCGAVLVCCFDGWEGSIGIKAEVAIAGELGIPVGYLVEPFNVDVVRHFVRTAGLVSIYHANHA